MFARLSSLKRSERLRLAGWILLASAVAAAAIVYWVQTRAAGPAIDDMSALGYRRSLDHQMGVMMGRFGLMLTEWQEALTTPTGEALLTFVGIGLFAAYFFRVAWVLDEEERDAARAHASGGGPEQA